jgi:hypothetical protein
MGKSLTHDPERAPLVRRAFEEYATGRCTKEQLLKRARTWGLTNRRGKPLTSQAIGMLLRDQLYAGIVDVPEDGVRGNRGDFELPRRARRRAVGTTAAADARGPVLPRSGGAVGSRAEHRATAAGAPGLLTTRRRPLRDVRTWPDGELVEGTTGHSSKRRFAKARPEPDFR